MTNKKTVVAVVFALVTTILLGVTVYQRNTLQQQEAKINSLKLGWANKIQYEEAYINLGDNVLVLSVQTNKTVYEYGENVYITVRATHSSDESVRIHYDNLRGTPHFVFDIELSNGEDTMIDMDTYEQFYFATNDGAEPTPQIMEIPGKENEGDWFYSHTETRRFSLFCFDGSNPWTMLNDRMPAAGVYNGIVRVQVETTEGIKTAELPFRITVAELEGEYPTHYYVSDLDGPLSFFY